ncbi:unnamed protein product [Kuraishia capsulata CBS 1993]|uniref:3-hydroxyisobutyryl-CoA hydrolase n=1 Tax=Kuraishia capsulata CBS 1993 TaxID=1382522 RepID=W6MGZ5_9ASCO|nr:uncharacterized protein KUCA_T00001153001 [Kuraishia capsulata CBS 1993]CDK25186.1 unnamed protein product [Kuraishia capsulata CBS 1993]
MLSAGKRAMNRLFQVERMFHTSSGPVRQINLDSIAVPQSEINDVLFNVRNDARVITLNRPAKLNALSTSMCKQILQRLLVFAKSDSNSIIVINSSVPKAFCSGGDVIECAKQNLTGNTAASVGFFEWEYNLNYLLATYSKPIVSLVNGIVMGGGVGLSVHTPFRVVDETTRFAMPETNIGFFCDVGTTFYLSRMDGNLGVYLALTGDELVGYDTYLAGFGTHFVPSERSQQLVETLGGLQVAELSNTEGEQSHTDLYPVINQAIESFSDAVPQGHQFKYSTEQLDVIEKCFGLKNKSVEEILRNLREDGSEFALQTIEKLSTKSPISLKLCFAMLQKSSKAGIYDAISNELKLASKMMVGGETDFNEAILKRLINKKSTNPEDKIANFKFPDVESVPSSLIEELISLDTSAIKTPSEKLSQESSESAVDLDDVFIDRFNNVSYVAYPHNMGLPTQAEVEAYIKGADDSNRKYSVTLKETLKYFDTKYRGKNGVIHKVKSIVERKTKGSQFGQEYLEWV